MSDAAIPEQTHVYRNLRTMTQTTFGFRKHPRIARRWLLVTPDGEVIGQFDATSRLYLEMKAGLSNHVILDTREPSNKEVIRSWITR